MEHRPEPLVPRPDPEQLLDLGQPFTPAMAARAGIGRSTLERLVRTGEVLRLVRGVYVGGAQPLTTTARARAVALVLGERHLLVDRTAAWIHGAPPLRPEPGAAIPLDVDGRRCYPGGRVPVGPDEQAVVAGVRCTVPARTALDVARHLAPERALPLVDGLLRAGAVSHPDLVRASDRDDLPGIDRARELLAVADGRADGIAESVLRLHWLGASLPTPVPGLRVSGARLALALPSHRFGVVLAGVVAPVQLDAVRAAGWDVPVLDPARICRGDLRSTAGHLEREFHRHLLRQSG